MQSVRKSIVNPIQKFLRFVYSIQEQWNIGFIEMLDEIDPPFFFIKH